MPGPHRHRVAAASGEALLWDLRSGAASGTLLGHTGSIVGAVALGETLWTAATDGTIRAWSLRAGDADAAPRTFALGAEALALATTTDGDAALVIDTDGGIWRLGGPERGEAADPGAQVRPDRGQRLDLAAVRLAVDAAPVARGAASGKFEDSHRFTMPGGRREASGLDRRTRTGAADLSRVRREF